MADQEETDAWPTWKCAVLTGVLCAVPLLPALIIFPRVAVLFWMTLILLYLGLVKFFGKGFVIAGAVIVLILAVLFFLLAPRFLDKPDPAGETMIGSNMLDEI